MTLEEFDTCQCHVSVHSLGVVFNDENIYCLISEHRENGKTITRFGNRTQVMVMRNAYRNTYNHINYKDW